MTTATDNFTSFTEWCRENYRDWPKGTMGRKGKVCPIGKLVMLATDVEANAVEGQKVVDAMAWLGA